MGSWKDGYTDEQMDGWMMSGWMDGVQMHGWYLVDNYHHCPTAPPRAA